MQLYCSSLFSYKRLPTKKVKAGSVKIGGDTAIKVQTMTTTDTMDTAATVQQSLRCIAAGAELVRITAPSKKEAENLKAIKDALQTQGYQTPLVADIHFTPNAAEIAARLIEKVRVNPGNYVDKKKFEQIEYTDAEYAEEIERIRERFTPLVRICKEHGTAMRIGTNHGSLSDRIMSRYGDTAMGMVESAMEFLRIARSEDYHNIVLSMKSSNPIVMVQAYRLLVQHMTDEFGEAYPLHLGVTEAGDGEDGRIKSAIGICSLLEDGIGDTIRVSLTEDPEFEIPVCLDIVKRYNSRKEGKAPQANVRLPYNPFEYMRRQTVSVNNIGGQHVPVVVADFSRLEAPGISNLASVGYNYDAATDKWSIGDSAADYIFLGDKHLDIALPGTLGLVMNYDNWLATVGDAKHIFPLFTTAGYLGAEKKSGFLNFIDINVDEDHEVVLDWLRDDPKLVACIHSSKENALQQCRLFMVKLMQAGIQNPVILKAHSNLTTVDEQLIDFSAHAGGLFLDGMGDGIWLSNDPHKMVDAQVSGRTYLQAKDNQQFLNNTAFSILQAVRTRISKTEYISCPSCGRTLFDLQETTAKIRKVTNHLKGLKIAIMGCIVNGPGEMADADFGYVGSGPGKITLYKGKEVVKRNISDDVAVEELISLLKENDAWTDPQ